MSPVLPSSPFSRHLLARLYVCFLLLGTSVSGIAQVSSSAAAPVTSKASAGASSKADADRELHTGWYLSLSPYTHHWYARPEHRPVLMAGLERYDPDNSLMGFAVFQNSFGEPTVYVYPWGQTYPNLFGVEKLTGKWSAGVLYGYLGRWQHEVPFNHNGFSPAFIPAVSWKLSNGYEAQISIPAANVMFQLQIPLKSFAR
jgi:hypothetical protein